jgi:hypothetical protein
MDSNQYHLAYTSSKTAYRVAAPVPIAAAPQDIAYYRWPNGTMLPIYGAEGRFVPVSARVSHYTTAHQAAQHKAAEDARKKAAEEKKKKAAEEKKKKKEEDEARKAVCIIEHRDGLTEGLLMVQARIIWAWDPTARQQRPVIPKGIDVPVQGYAYMYRHDNGNYRYYK